MIDASAVARVVGIETKFKDLRGGSTVFLPQRVPIVGQGSTAATYSLTKQRITSSGEAGVLYGFGSPIHLAARQLFPDNGDGVGSVPVTVYPLAEDGSGVVSDGDLTPSGTQTEGAAYRVAVNNILSEQFVISVGDVVADIVTAMTAAINAVLEMPIIATDGTTLVTTASKWKGASANDIFMEVVGPSEAGTSFSITQHTGGLVNPDVQPALDQIGEVWETLIVNCLNIEDSSALDTYKDFGEGRWGPITRKPLMVFTGTVETDVSVATTIPDARKTDRVNSQIPEPGSNDLPLAVAARAVARIAVKANNNPPFDYGSSPLQGLVPGADGDQWNYVQRDLAVKAGSSTIEVKNGETNLSDTVTFYHPDGEVNPAYRYVVDIIKLQNVIFNLSLIFATPEWDGAPLVPDDQPTTGASGAKRPKTAVMQVARMLDGLAVVAIISDPNFSKQNTSASISATNPKRLDVVTTVKLSGNANIISVDLNFGFFFGTLSSSAG